MAGFKDFLLKEEIIRAIQEAGFEKPSEVQNTTINKAVNGRDILCQAQAGTGKTAVFVISILNQLSKDAKECSCLVLAPVRELATQIRDEFKRFAKFLPFKVEAYFGGSDIGKSIDSLRNFRPHIVVGCPGRTLELVNKGHLKLNNVKYFVVDECDRMLSDSKMRSDVQ